MIALFDRPACLMMGWACYVNMLHVPLTLRMRHENHRNQYIYDTSHTTLFNYSTTNT